MNIDDIIIETLWDKKVFGIDTFEIKHCSEDIIEHILKRPGHYTVKVEPLTSKKLLHDYGFYYCDSLIEPYCTPDMFIFYKDKMINISKEIAFEDIVFIVRGAFVYGRFHRDFNIDTQLADLRYENWLKELYESGRCFGMLYGGEIAGFFGFTGNKIVLHALNEKYRGKGLAKYFWCAACKELFAMGYNELISSISAVNLSVLNLYASLGFRFRNPVDIYHLIVK